MMHHCTNVVIIIGISVAWYLTDEDGLTAPCFTWAKKCIYQTSEIYLKRVLYSLDTTCMHTCVQKECNVDEMREGGGLWKKEDRIQSTVQRWMVENRLDYNRIIWLEMVENRLDYNRINWLEIVENRLDYDRISWLEMVENRLDYNRIIWLEMVENRLDYNRISWLEMVENRLDYNRINWLEMVENRLDYNRINWLEMVENRLDYNRINWLEMVDSRITTLTFVYLWLILILLIPSLDLFSHIPLLTVPPPPPPPPHLLHNLHQARLTYGCLHGVKLCCTVGHPFHPCVTAVACKGPHWFFQKCRWQVTAKHACTLHMWLCMKCCKLVHGCMVHTECALRRQQLHTAPAM